MLASKVTRASLKAWMSSSGAGGGDLSGLIRLATPSETTLAASAMVFLLRAGTSGVRCEGSAAEGEAGAGATGAAALGVTAGGEPMVSDGPGCGAWGELVVGE